MEPQPAEAGSFAGVKETNLRYESDERYMCDFLDYEIKDMLRMKKFIEDEALEEEPELENAEEQPITITQQSIQDKNVVLTVKNQRDRQSVRLESSQFLTYTAKSAGVPLRVIGSKNTSGVPSVSIQTRKIETRTNSNVCNVDMKKGSQQPAIVYNASSIVIFTGFPLKFLRTSL